MNIRRRGNSAGGANREGGLSLTSPMVPNGLSFACTPAGKSSSNCADTVKLSQKANDTETDEGEAVVRRVREGGDDECEGGGHGVIAIKRDTQGRDKEANRGR